MLTEDEIYFINFQVLFICILEHILEVCQAIYKTPHFVHLQNILKCKKHRSSKCKSVIQFETISHEIALSSKMFYFFKAEREKMWLLNQADFGLTCHSFYGLS